MAIAKIILNSASQIDLTSDTVTADKLLQGYTAHDASGTQITGTASGGGTVVIYKDSDGYIVIGSEDCGVDGLVSKDSDGYIVIPEELITEIKLQGKTTTPTEEYQAIYPDSGYDGLEYVGVDPIPSAYADVTDTTAVATDVAAGKIFYTSEGVRTSGTASGGGGDFTAEDLAKGTITGVLDLGTATSVRKSLFEGCAGITSIIAPNVTVINDNAFYGCHASSVSFPNLEQIKAYGLNGVSATMHFPKVTTVAQYGVGWNYGGSSTSPIDIALVLPSVTTLTGDALRGYYGKYIDLGESLTSVPTRMFYSAPSNQIIILRCKSQVVTAETSTSLQSINSNTKVYVPSSLISSYQSATNWSTKGDIFYAIEGSQYENYYADGTPIT